MLKIGKVLPTSLIPWVENRTTAIVKVAPLELSGLKWRTCVDMTASLCNDAVEKRGFGMPRVEDVIALLGRNYWMVKQDLTDMFFNWKIHHSKWMLFGFQHPLTGQSFIYPVLPFGFRLSPPIACANTQLMADIITEEARNRAEGLEGRPALMGVHTPGIVEQA